jgi:hypothetical protein
MPTDEWIARKWRGVRTSAAVIGVAGIAVGWFLLLHVWTFSDSQGVVGSCAAVISISGRDSLGQLGVPAETATAFCDQQRSEHAREGIAVLAFGAFVIGFAAWAHVQSVWILRDAELPPRRS